MTGFTLHVVIWSIAIMKTLTGVTWRLCYPNPFQTKLDAVTVPTEVVNWANSWLISNYIEHSDVSRSLNWILHKPCDIQHPRLPVSCDKATWLKSETFLLLLLISLSKCGQSSDTVTRMVWTPLNCSLLWKFENYGLNAELLLLGLAAVTARRATSY